MPKRYSVASQLATSDILALIAMHNTGDDLLDAENIQSIMDREFNVQLINKYITHILESDDIVEIKQILCTLFFSFKTMEN